MGKKFTDKAGSIEITQQDYCILKCTNCGLYFRSPILDDKELALHYANYDFKTLHHVALFPTERTIYEFLKARKKDGVKRSILDYGCNEGNFLSLFVGDYKCYGIEIDDRVKELAENKGISMVEDADIQRMNLKFDYILLIDVFEHLHNPTKTIEYFVNNLNSGGQLIISTGYADSECCKNELANYWYFSQCIQHLCMIGKDYIDYLRRQYKLKLVVKKRMSHYDFKIGFRESLFYNFRYKVYLAYHFLDKKKPTRSLIKFIPVLNKARSWKTPPYHPMIQNPNMQKDHVVLVFKKTG